MTDLSKIILTSMTTAVAGVGVFVFGQIIVRYVLDPAFDQRKTVADVGDDLLFLAHFYANPTTTVDPARSEAASKLRLHASRLGSRSLAVPMYKAFEKAGFLLPWSDIVRARNLLFRISNSMTHPGDGVRNIDDAEMVRGLLRLPADSAA